jgi:hypothetical protein
MASSGMLRRVTLVRTEVSEELSVAIIRVTRIGELGTTLAVTSNRRTLWRNTKWKRKLVTANVVPSTQFFVTLMMEALSSSETSDLTRATGVTSQKTAFFMLTAVKTSYLTMSRRDCKPKWLRPNVRPWYGILPQCVSVIVLSNCHGCLAPSRLHM